jgi:hypothetical protein
MKLYMPFIPDKIWAFDKKANMLIKWEAKDPERLNPTAPCKHEWGSEERSDSSNPFYVCNKCGRCDSLNSENE